ncbi:hypothetical protein ATN37_27085 [Rhodococcus sp. MH15]|nr:hypothetical protein [Rhodococcus sp. MH15]
MHRLFRDQQQNRSAHISSTTSSATSSPATELSARTEAGAGSAVWTETPPPMASAWHVTEARPLVRSTASTTVSIAGTIARRAVVRRHPHHKWWPLLTAETAEETAPAEHPLVRETCIHRRTSITIVDSSTIYRHIG